MRARWLKPEFFRDKKIGAAGPVVALVYEALWCLADDDGVAQCDPEAVKGEMFVWWSAVGVPEITGALRHLSDHKLIALFWVGDGLFCRIRSFKKHQPIHKPSKFRHPSSGQPVRWDGEALVPDDTGTTTAPPDSLSPRHLDTQSSTTRARGLPPEIDRPAVQQFLARMPAHRRDGYIGRFRNWLDGTDLPVGVLVTPNILVAAIDEYDGGDTPDLLLRFVCRKARTLREHAADTARGKRSVADDAEANALAGALAIQQRMGGAA